MKINAKTAIVMAGAAWLVCRYLASRTASKAAATAGTSVPAQGFAAITPGGATPAGVYS